MFFVHCKIKSCMWGTMALRSVDRSAVTCIVGTPCFSLKMIS